MPSPNTGGATAPASQTGNVLVDALNSGVRWASTDLTYSFPSAGAAWSSDPSISYSASTREPWNGFVGLTAEHQFVVRSALQAWSDVSAVRFSEVAESADQVGELRFGMSSSLSEYDYAWAYYPSSNAPGGDVWLNGNKSAWIYGSWAKGSYEYFALLHEIGHALGLKHPHEGGTVAPTDYDSRTYTVMSYDSLPGDRGSSLSYYPTTPMLLDIAAIQQLYGPQAAGHAGNDTYVFDEYSQYHETLWDSGGVDTIRSISSRDATIHLGAGSASRVGAPIYAFPSAGGIEQIDNVWIAYGTTIENAIGGAGNDTLVGNPVANRLDGGAGNDLMVGGLGNDTYVVQAVGDKIVEEHGEGTDTVYTQVSYTLADNVEHLRATGSAGLKLTGNALNNLIWGASGADKLSGGKGNDHLDGSSGSDTLYGGAGADTFGFTTRLGNTNVDRIADFRSVDDRLLLDDAVFAKLATGKLAKGTLRVDDHAHDKNDYLVYDQDHGKLYYDADGSGAHKAVLFATFAADTELARADFWIA